MRLQGRVRRQWLRSCCSHSCPVVAKPFALLVYGLLFLGLSFPTSIVKELAISSDPVAPDCPRVTGKSVSGKSKFTSLTFRKAIVWARWSLPPTRAGVSSLPKCSVHFCSSGFLSLNAKPLRISFHFPRSISAHLLQNAWQLQLVLPTHLFCPTGWQAHSPTMTCSPQASFLAPRYWGNTSETDRPPAGLCLGSWATQLSKCFSHFSTYHIDQRALENTHWPHPHGF